MLRLAHAYVLNLKLNNVNKSFEIVIEFDHCDWIWTSSKCYAC